MKKKLLLVCIAGLMAAFLAACGSGGRIVLADWKNDVILIIPHFAAAKGLMLLL